MDSTRDNDRADWISSVHLEYIENREREANENDEAVVKKFLESRLMNDEACEPSPA
jgi:hypothetical protein